MDKGQRKLGGWYGTSQPANGTKYTYTLGSAAAGRRTAELSPS